MTISLGKLSFEYANACYVATIMIQQVQRSSIYTDSFNFVIDAGGNDSSHMNSRANTILIVLHVRKSHLYYKHNAKR